MPKVKNSHTVHEDEIQLKKRKTPLGHASAEEMERLERLVFGNASEVIEDIDSDSDRETSYTSDIPPLADRETRKPAWTDDDESSITVKEAAVKRDRKTNNLNGGSMDYNEVLRSKFESVYGKPKWAELPPEKLDNSKLKIFERSGKWIKKPESLQPGKLDFKQLTELNKQTHTEGALIKVVKFHPKSTIGMVGGISGIVSLFQVDGKENPKLQSLKFDRYPVYCGSFLKDGEELLVGSRNHSFFHLHNLITGQSSRVMSSDALEVLQTNKFCVSPNDDYIAVTGTGGCIYLLSVKTKQFIGNMKMNGKVHALSFNHDGSQLFSHGSNGEVYIWDMKTRQCSHKFIDNGCLMGTSLSVSKNNQLLACGSTSGIVNIYEINSIINQMSPKPLKVIDNLVTSIKSLQFNPFSEILSVSSADQNNAVKLVHFPSMTVYNNFPSLNAKWYKPQCSDFSPNSGYYAIGNSNGTALLYRLKYYGNY